MPGFYLSSCSCWTPAGWIGFWGLKKWKVSVKLGCLCFWVELVLSFSAPFEERLNPFIKTQTLFSDKQETMLWFLTKTRMRRMLDTFNGFTEHPVLNQESSKFHCRSQKTWKCAGLTSLTHSSCTEWGKESRRRHDAMSWKQKDKRSGSLQESQTFCEVSLTELHVFVQKVKIRKVWLRFSNRRLKWSLSAGKQEGLLTGSV